MSGRFVGPDQRPEQHPFYGDSYERGLDPWHADAFRGLEGELGCNPGITGERKSGWFLLDGHGNVIGFVPDGTPIPQTAAIVESPTPLANGGGEVARG